MKSFLDEFKKFVLRGSVMDLAIGIVIGTAFTSIVNALVTDIITPPIGLLTGKINFAELVLNLGGSVKIQYGLFIQACFTFVIIAFALFLMIRFMNRLTKKQKASKSPDAKSAELLVLEEIRDSLKK